MTTFAGKNPRALMVEIRQSRAIAGQTAAARDYDLENKKVGLSYTIDAPSTLPKDEETMAHHQILGRQETKEWELNVVKNREGSDAIITGVIQNSFDEVAGFVNITEEDVTLKPVFLDVMAERSLKTESFFKERLNEYEAQTEGFINSPPPHPKVPAFDFFSGRDSNEEANKHDEGMALKLPAALKDKLNASEYTAMANLVGHNISIIWGPPGTGKSKVIAEAIMFFLEHTHEKMVSCAVANVAVNTIFHKVLNAYVDIHTDRATAPFAMVYTQNQILAQYAAMDKATLEYRYYIEA